MKKIITICAFAACLTGCDDLFEPAIENNLGLEYMYENSQYAEGILANAYTRIPCAGYSFNDVATDDAVSNACGRQTTILPTVGLPAVPPYSTSIFSLPMPTR